MDSSRSRRWWSGSPRYRSLHRGPRRHLSRTDPARARSWRRPGCSIRTAGRSGCAAVPSGAWAGPGRLGGRIVLRIGSSHRLRSPLPSRLRVRRPRSASARGLADISSRVLTPGSQSTAPGPGRSRPAPRRRFSRTNGLGPSAFAEQPAPGRVAQLAQHPGGERPHPLIAVVARRCRRSGARTSRVLPEDAIALQHAVGSRSRIDCATAASRSGSAAGARRRRPRTGHVAGTGWPVLEAGQPAC